MELKFRAWNGKIMITNFSVINGKGFVETNPKENSGYVDVIDKDGRRSSYYKVWATYQEFDYPIMQYTGLHDKNGKEIFEGDIVKYYSVNHVIRHCDNHAQILIGKDLLTDGYAMVIEVIGNIHENIGLIGA